MYIFLVHLSILFTRINLREEEIIYLYTRKTRRKTKTNGKKQCGSGGTSGSKKETRKAETTKKDRGRKRQNGSKALTDPVPFRLTGCCPHQVHSVPWIAIEVVLEPTNLGWCPGQSKLSLMFRFLRYPGNFPSRAIRTHTVAEDSIALRLLHLAPSLRHLKSRCVPRCVPRLRRLAAPRNINPACLRSRNASKAGKSS